MAPKGKPKLSQQIVRLISSAGTGYFYMATRRRTLGHKLQFIKYDPVVRQRVLFVEGKKSG